MGWANKRCQKGSVVIQQSAGRGQGTEHCTVTIILNGRHESTPTLLHSYFTTSRIFKRCGVIFKCMYCDTIFETNLYYLYKKTPGRVYHKKLTLDMYGFLLVSWVFVLFGVFLLLFCVCVCVCVFPAEMYLAHFSREKVFLVFLRSMLAVFVIFVNMQIKNNPQGSFHQNCTILQNWLLVRAA